MNEAIKIRILGEMVPEEYKEKLINMVASGPDGARMAYEFVLSINLEEGEEPSEQFEYDAIQNLLYVVEMSDKRNELLDLHKLANSTYNHAWVRKQVENRPPRPKAGGRFLGWPKNSPWHISNIFKKMKEKRAEMEQPHTDFYDGMQELQKISREIRHKH